MKYYATALFLISNVAYADTMTITLPASTTAGIGDQVTSLITTLAPVIFLILGLLLAFNVIEFIVGLFRKIKDDQK
jgi:hypothetical protein